MGPGLRRNRLKINDISTENQGKRENSTDNDKSNQLCAGFTFAVNEKQQIDMRWMRFLNFCRKTGWDIGKFSAKQQVALRNTRNTRIEKAPYDQNGER